MRVSLSHTLHFLIMTVHLWGGILVITRSSVVILGSLVHFHSLNAARHFTSILRHSTIPARVSASGTGETQRIERHVQLSTLLKTPSRVRFKVAQDSGNALETERRGAQEAVRTDIDSL